MSEELKKNIVNLVKKAKKDFRNSTNMQKLIRLSELSEDKLLEEGQRMSSSDKKDLSVALGKLNNTLSTINKASHLHPIKDINYASQKAKYT